MLNNISIDSDVRIEIRSALLAGKEVTVHESSINTFGWTGSSYIISDPITGSGAYKISGGANGGYALLVDGLALLILSGLVINPVLGIVLMVAAFQVIGCALAWITSDEDWYDVFGGFGWYAGGAMFGGGAAGVVIGGLLAACGIATNVADVGVACANLP